MYHGRRDLLYGGHTPRGTYIGHHAYRRLVRERPSLWGGRLDGIIVNLPLGPDLDAAALAGETLSAALAQ